MKLVLFTKTTHREHLPLLLFPSATTTLNNQQQQRRFVAIGTHACQRVFFFPRSPAHKTAAECIDTDLNRASGTFWVRISHSCCQPTSCRLFLFLFVLLVFIMCILLQSMTFDVFQPFQRYTPWDSWTNRTETFYGSAETDNYLIKAVEAVASVSF